MRNTHQASQYLEISGPNHSAEVEVVVEFDFHKGYAASGPSYSSGGEPGEPDSVEVTGFQAFEIVKSAEGQWVTGPQIVMSPWLEAFIEKAIDESELLNTVSDYDEVF